MKRVTFIFMIFLSLLFAKETLVFTAPELPPLTSKSLYNNGYLCEIVKESFKRVGYDIKFEFYPFLRAVYLSDKNERAGIINIYYDVNKNDFLEYTKPIGNSKIYFITLKINPIEYSNLASLKNYKIGLMRGGFYGKEFEKATFLKKEETTEYIENLKKLFAGRIDIILGDFLVYNYIYEKNKKTFKTDLVALGKPVLEPNIFLAISKNNKN